LTDCIQRHPELPDHPGDLSTIEARSGRHAQPPPTGRPRKIPRQIRFYTGCRIHHICQHLRAFCSSRPPREISASLSQVCIDSLLFYRSPASSRTGCGANQDRCSSPLRNSLEGALNLTRDITARIGSTSTACGYLPTGSSSCNHFRGTIFMASW